MKQTITILSALVAALLVASGFIVAANVDLCTDAADYQHELSDLRIRFTDAQQSLERREQEAAVSAETIQKLTRERDALSQQLNDAVLASQEANDAIAHQMDENSRQLLQLESLRMDYEEMLQTCTALEAQLTALHDQAAQTALAYEQQTLQDAQRIQNLEKALQDALLPSPAPTTVRHPSHPAV